MPLSTGDIESLRLLALDLDNTLYPHAQYVSGAYDEIADALANASGHSPSFIKDYMLNLWQQHGSHWPYVFSSALQKLNLPAAPWLKQCLTLYHAHDARHIKPWPDALPFLAGAKQKYRLALISDGHHATQMRKLKRLKLENSFEPILISQNFGAEAYKPAPHMFNALLETTYLHPHQILYIGDDPRVDVEGARAIGLKTLRIRRGEYEAVEPTAAHQIADKVVTSFSELASIVQLRTNREIPSL